MNRPAPATLAAQAARHLESGTGAVTPAIQPSTTFARGSDYEPMGGYVYSRYGNPTVEQAEALLAELDEGAEARLFASGLAAMATLIQSVPPGGRVVAPSVMYHGTRDLLRRHAATGRIELTLIDQVDPAARQQALRAGKTDLMLIETPANPSWDIVDIEQAATDAHAAAAMLVVDSTCAPPCTTTPLTLGADIVLHSATKYLNGHSDVTAGVLVTREVNQRWQAIDTARGFEGGVLAPFEAWLLVRGLRTLFVRFERQSANAMAVASHLGLHPNIEQVLYPGLAGHPGHEIARRQMIGGFGGMLSVLVRGDEAAARAVATRTNVWVPATSLGGVESLIEHRRSIEGPESPIAPNLLRLSTGIEDAADLIDDLEQALAGI